MKKYYYASYLIKSFGDLKPTPICRCLDIHPIQQMILWNKEYPSNTYALISWNEISEEEYKLFNGKF